MSHDHNAMEERFIRPQSSAYFFQHKGWCRPLQLSVRITQRELNRQSSNHIVDKIENLYSGVHCVLSRYFLQPKRNMPEG